MMRIRPPAVAGLFYPRDPHALRHLIEQSFAAARPSTGPVPKAIIVPHAGYIYSGPIAASAYARLRGGDGRIRRVVLLGPAHRVALRGLALPDCEAFSTPLGEIPLDIEGMAQARTLPGVQVHDAAHAREHSLEVHLPFLQGVLAPGFTLVPLVVGSAPASQVAAVIEALAGGPETLVVVSSDLSHYLPYEEAQVIDQQTCAAIEARAPERIEPEGACGRVPVAGLLVWARQHGLSVQTLDLRSSGDTAGDRQQVVGYGAWALQTVTA